MATLSSDNHGLRLAVRYAVLVLIAVIFIFPLVFTLMSSLKPDQQLLTDTGSLRAFLPVGDISLDNYFAAFKRAPVGLFVFNSVLVTGVTVVLSLLVCSMAAFALVFTNWRGRDLKALPPRPTWGHGHCNRRCLPAALASWKCRRCSGSGRHGTACSAPRRTIGLLPAAPPTRNPR